MFYLLPYIKGSVEGKALRKSLFEAKLSALDTVVLQLKAPSENPTPALAEFKRSLDEEMDRFWESHPVLGVAFAFEEGSIQLPTSKATMQVARLNDLRYLQWDWFLQYTDDLERIAEDLRKRDASSVSVAMSRWCGYVEELRSIIQRRHAMESTLRSPILIGVTVVMTFLVSKGSDSLWKYIEQSLLSK